MTNHNSIVSFTPRAKFLQQNSKLPSLRTVLIPIDFPSIKSYFEILLSAVFECIQIGINETAINIFTACQKLFTQSNYSIINYETINISNWRKNHVPLSIVSINSFDYFNIQLNTKAKKFMVFI